MSWIFQSDQKEYWTYCKNLFTPDECNAIIQLANLKEKLIANIEGNGVVDKSIRQNKVSWLNRHDNIDWIYEKISYAVINMNQKYFNFDLTGIVEDLQFTEYSEIGDKYEYHIDSGKDFYIRKISVVVQLSDPKTYDGSELNIMYKSIPDIAIKDQGSLIMFPSYMLHKVTPLLKGTRYSLVGWVSGPPLK
jgi:PKHD-type hydroxylase